MYSCSKYHKSSHPGQLYHSLAGPDVATCEPLAYFMGFCCPSLLSNLQDHPPMAGALCAPRSLLPRGRWHPLTHCSKGDFGAAASVHPGAAHPLPPSFAKDRGWTGLGVTDTSLQVVCQLLRCRLAEGREAVDSCRVSGAGASVLKAPISAALGSCSASLTSCSNYKDREQVRY